MQNLVGREVRIGETVKVAQVYFVVKAFDTETVTLHGAFDGWHKDKVFDRRMVQPSEFQFDADLASYNQPEQKEEQKT